MGVSPPGLFRSDVGEVWVGEGEGELDVEGVDSVCFFQCFECFCD